MHQLTDHLFIASVTCTWIPMIKNTHTLLMQLLCWPFGFNRNRRLTTLNTKSVSLCAHVQQLSSTLFCSMTNFQVVITMRDQLWASTWTCKCPTHNFHLLLCMFALPIQVLISPVNQQNYYLCFVFQLDIMYAKFYPQNWGWNHVFYCLIIYKIRPRTCCHV